jgi:hypothetical protein
VEARGGKYELWSEPPTVELENVRFLAGHRSGSAELVREGEPRAEYGAGEPAEATYAAKARELGEDILTAVCHPS